MITSLLIFILGILYIYLTMTVIKGRYRNKVSLGASDSNEMLYLTSAHSNFSSYAPLFIISIYLLEIQSVYAAVIYILSFAFIIGRILHMRSLINQEKTFKHRRNGMILTILPLAVSFGCHLFIYLHNQFITWHVHFL